MLALSGDASTSAGSTAITLATINANISVIEFKQRMTVSQAERQWNWFVARSPRTSH
jgi:hypothetical protein